MKSTGAGQRLHQVAFDLTVSKHTLVVLPRSILAYTLQVTNHPVHRHIRVVLTDSCHQHNTKSADFRR
jgi:hypothetical protein